MFDTLLVANRGAIARRIFRTAKEMGIRTVAIFADADASAAHIGDADLAVPIGGRASADSYLDIGKVLEAAERAGAQAIHPGYGFLSENPDFAQACADAGLVFIGPSPQVIRRMALKDRAKEVARAAGVPVQPDAPASGHSPADWRAAGDSVGYPLLVKAVAGGGGRGMRLVKQATDLPDAIRSARREALSAFGNDEVFLERFLVPARHIEIQVVGDLQGQVVHFGERECSVQRRHQKVLEEAPSAAIDAGIREVMGQTSVGLVKHLGYTGAGTVEYLYDDRSKEFHFLEMNTRLQVEHAVTEEAYGVDLVRLQLEVSAGLPLAITQHQIAPARHAIEVRLYAEDPARDFLPAPGVIRRYAHPARRGIRYEDTLARSGEIPAFYDALLAKVIATAMSRDEAARQLAAALEQTVVHGTPSNRDFLIALLRDEDFRNATTSTDFLEHHAALRVPPPATPRIVHLAAAISTQLARARKSAVPPGFRVMPGGIGPAARWRGPDGDVLEVAYRMTAYEPDRSELLLDLQGSSYTCTVRDLRPDHVRVTLDGIERPCAVARYDDGSVWVNDPAAQSRWERLTRLGVARSPAISGSPVAEMPGTVVSVLVTAGQHIKAGEPLVVVEAMKMEHPARASHDGVVTAIHVEVGQYVEMHAALVTLGELP